ncbi:MAG: TM2 domain-containing protein [Prevotella sp.]|nr:TM2 domain-containing protein [Prevotella sp.]
MTREQAEQLIQVNADKIAPEFIETIRERLLNADEGTATAAFAGLKGTTMMTLIAWLGGSLGIDRFMLGETGLGVAKLLTCGGCGIWGLIDIFTAGGRTRKYNANKILEQI